MGGVGSGRPPSVETLVARQYPEQTPIGDGVFLPNFSGLLEGAKKTDADPFMPKSYIDSQIQGENHWDMNTGSTMIYPHVSGVRVSGANLSVSGSTIYTTSSGNVGIGTTSPSNILDISKTENTAYDGTSNTGQSTAGATLNILKGGTTANSFAQINFQLSPASNEAVARIVGIYTGSHTSDLAFVTENSNTRAEKMRILGSGNVGIGTTSPTHKLTVTGDIRIDGGNALSIKSDDGTGSWTFTDDGSENMQFKGDSGIGGGFDFQTYNGGYGSRLMITNAGNVGIGTTSPGVKLDVIGNIVSRYADASTYYVNMYSDGTNGFVNSNRGYLRLSGQAGTGVVVDSAGNVGIGTTSPSSRLNIVGSGATSATSALNVTNSAGTSALFVRNDGNVGVGTTSPSTKLHVSGGAVTIFNTSAPSTPSNAGALYVSGGALYYIGSSGTITLLANA